MVFKAPMHAQASGIKSTFVWSRIWLFTYVIDNFNKKYDGNNGFVLGEKSCKHGYKANLQFFWSHCEYARCALQKFGQVHGADRNERTLMYQESEMQNSSTFSTISA